jgi:hypothetical protein
MALRPWATHYPIYQADAIPANLRRIPHQERLASFGGYRFSSIA